MVSSLFQWLSNMALSGGLNKEIEVLSDTSVTQNNTASLEKYWIVSSLEACKSP